MIIIWETRIKAVVKTYYWMRYYSDPQAGKNFRLIYGINPNLAPLGIWVATDV